ncbi:MAG TPA: hypothetical protein VIO16_00890 [Dehalococcoidia bacterium]
MIPEGTKPNEDERYLSLGAVAGRFLVRIDDVHRWIGQGRLKTVTGPRGKVLIPESALLEFQRTAYRRENYNGTDHGLHSWPTDIPEVSNLPMIPVQNFQQAEANAPIWPFAHATPRMAAKGD